MTKQELVRDMKQSFDGSGFLSAKQVAQYRGVHPNTITRFLKGVEYTKEGGGNRKYYFVGDVADRILQNKAM